ncbi:hypothetical protein E4U21_000312 [Claviceps maximensis]|nr:hypothetical protein E4U21_000312 [Claviceps maximensis]
MLLFGHHTRHLPRLRTRLRTTLPPPSRVFRSLHSAIAKFTTLDAQGNVITYDTSIMIGDPCQTVYVKPEIGNAIRSAIVAQEQQEQLGESGVGKSNKLRLKFYPITCHFGPPESMRRSSNPATLLLSGNWHAITLDPPGSSRKWRQKARKMKWIGTLEKLKESWILHDW